MPETVYGAFLLLGGIGLFLYGINYVSKSLEDAAGDNLRKILEKTTGNGFFAFLIGILVTVLIQSSGVTSVITVGFVNAGFMELVNALYVMLGANIGTTVTSQIIAFKIDSVARSYCSRVRSCSCSSRIVSSKRPAPLYSASVCFSWAYS